MGTAQPIINCFGQFVLCGCFLRSVAFFHGSESTSTAVDDKGIVQFDHKFFRFF